MRLLVTHINTSFTLAYGARKSRAVICILNLPVLVNFPMQVPKLIRLSLAILVAFLMMTSLVTKMINLIIMIVVLMMMELTMMVLIMLIIMKVSMMVWS